MPTDRERRELFEALRTEIGDGPASTLMESLPPYDWNDLARRADVEALGTSLRGEIALLRGEMDQRFAAVETGFARVENRFAGVEGKISELRGEMDGRFAQMETRFAHVENRFAALGTRVLAANIGLAFGTAGVVLAAVKLA